MACRIEEFSHLTLRIENLFRPNKKVTVERQTKTVLVTQVVQSCFAQLRQLTKIRSFPSSTDLEKYVLIPIPVNASRTPSQQDGIFDCGEEPEHLSLQHLSILFCCHTTKPGPLLQNTTKSSTELQADGAGQGAAGVGQSRCDISEIMTSNKEARPFHTMTTAAPEDTQGDSTRSRQEQEEKLILTAWQNMSSALQQHSLREHSRAPGPAQSFLSKQRQSTQARRALSPRLQPR